MDPIDATTNVESPVKTKIEGTGFKMKPVDTDPSLDSAEFDHESADKSIQNLREDLHKLEEKGEKQQWIASRIAITTVVNVQVDDLLKKFKNLSKTPLTGSAETIEETEKREEECEKILLTLLEKILESAKYELRIGWAQSLTRHMRTGGYASIKSLS